MMRTPSNLDKLAAILAQSDDFRVLRRLTRPEATLPRPNAKIGVIIDVETTGLDSKSDEIIQLAMLKFAFDEAGAVIGALGEFDQLNQPAAGIPRAIQQLTGITNNTVHGRSINSVEVSNFVADASIVIAHNASFDRPFCERYWSVFTDKPWACTATELNWATEGVDSSKLSYILMRYGFFYDSHNAIWDCLAVYQILIDRLPGSRRGALAELLQNARRPTVRIWAENTSFDVKDVLKLRGYRWNDGADGTPRCWWKDVLENDTASEIQFLRREIYGSEVAIPTKRYNAFDRFSRRAVLRDQNQEEGF